MKKRKIPIRKCLGCGEGKEKKQLIRIVKTPEGEILVDTSGKANGRGAYICNNSDCLEKAIKNRSINRSLKADITPEIYEKLKEKME